MKLAFMSSRARLAVVTTPVIAERRSRRIRDLFKGAGIVTIPDNAVGVSGMTAAESNRAEPVSSRAARGMK